MNIPKKLEVGDSVIVKFGLETIGERNQGKGWHSGKVTYVYPDGEVDIKLDRLTKHAEVVFGNLATAVVPLNHPAKWERQNFAGTVVRKIQTRSQKEGKKA